MTHRERPKNHFKVLRVLGIVVGERIYESFAHGRKQSSHFMHHLWLSLGKLARCRVGCPRSNAQEAVAVTLLEFSLLLRKRTEDIQEFNGDVNERKRNQEKLRE